MGLKDLKYEPRRTTLRLVLDDSVRRELEEATAAAKAEKARDDSTLGSESAATRRLEEATTAAEEAAVSFVFEALSRPRLAELINACPPTSEQLDQWKEAARSNPLIVVDPPGFDFDAFAPRLIAASLIEPETTEAEVVELWEEGGWSDPIWLALWDAAWKRTNQAVPTLPTFGTDTKRT